MAIHLDLQVSLTLLSNFGSALRQRLTNPIYSLAHYAHSLSGIKNSFVSLYMRNLHACSDSGTVQKGYYAKR